MNDTRIKTQTQTCFACPDQWEGELTNGLFFYFRYRGGQVRLGLGTTIDSATSAAFTAFGAYRPHGDGLQGIFDDEETRDRFFTDMLDELYVTRTV